MIEYLELPVRSLALGTLLVPRVLVERGHWQAITNRARAFVDYAANPHVYAAQFLAMMGIGSPQAASASAGNPRIANIPTMPVPPGMVDPTFADIPARSGADPAARSGFDPAASSSGFKPWDSRPVELGDDEDWLR